MGQYKLLVANLILILFYPSIMSANMSCLPDDDVSYCLCSESAGKRLFHSTVKCQATCFGAENQVTVVLERTYCLTYDNATRQLVTGKCPFAYQDYSNLSMITVENTNAFLCNPYKRNGTLCGSCDDDHSLTVNSYASNCISKKQCNSLYWLLYLLEQFLPLTFFYILIVILQINVIADWANVFIVFAQTVSLSINLFSIEFTWRILLNNERETATALTKSIAAFYGIWNLDFSIIFPPLCVGEMSSILWPLFLQYVIAFYPVALIVITYIFILLHDHNIKPVVILWRPFHIFFARFQQKLHVRNTIIHAFATFLLLSFTKLTVTSFIVIAPTPLYNKHGDIVDYVMLYDGSVRFLRGNHIGFFIVALLVLMFIVIPLPLLLLLYPLSHFQKLMNKLKLRSHLLTCFTDIFQSPFKNGTNGASDRRFFAGFYFIIRIIFFGIYSYVTDIAALYIMQFIFISLAGLTMLVLQPYKRDFFNKFDVSASFYINVYIVFRMFISLRLMTDLASNDVVSQILWVNILTYVFLILPIIYVIAYITFTLTKNLLFKLKKKVVKKLQKVVPVSKRRQLQREPTLPDRLTRPEDYDCPYTTTSMSASSETEICTSKSDMSSTASESTSD